MIAAVHGACIGAGMDLITACDLRLATADATFSVRETRIAMVADVGTLQRLPRLIGDGAAREWIFTGGDYTAQQAQSVQLLNEVLPDPDALMQRARALAATIAANSPLAVQGSKHVLGQAVRRETDANLDYVALWNAAFLHSEDLGEAMQAFMARARRTSPDNDGRSCPAPAGSRSSQSRAASIDQAVCARATGAASRSSRRRILPTLLFGNSSRNSMYFGLL